MTKRWAAALGCAAFGCALACGPNVGASTSSGPGSTDTSGTGDTGGADAGDADAGDAETGGIECEAVALGEVGSCDCATLDGCRLDQRLDLGCSLDCSLPEPCPRLICTYDSAHDPPGCQLAPTDDETECILDTLELGAPARVTLRIESSYLSSSQSTQRVIDILGPDPEDPNRLRFASREFEAYSNDVSEFVFYYERIEAGAFVGAPWRSCETLTGRDRFECMLGLAGESCEDPGALACP